MHITNEEYNQYEPFLDKSLFVTHSQLINEYGITPPSNSIYTLYIKDESLFKQYQTSNLVTINSQTGPTTISEDLLGALIKDRGLFKYLLL